MKQLIREIIMIRKIIFLLSFLLPILLLAEMEVERYEKESVMVQLTAEALLRTNLPEGVYEEARDFGIQSLNEIFYHHRGKVIVRAHIRPKDREWEIRTGFNRWFIVRFESGVDPKRIVSVFEKMPEVERAMIIPIGEFTFVPNDPLYSLNWGHNNTGQFLSYQNGSFSGPPVGIVGFDTKAQQAWDDVQGMGNANIIIAILDTGVDSSHPDLRLVPGYNAVDNSTNTSPLNGDGHGTACAGIAAAIGNNNLGVVGIAGGCSIMPIQIKQLLDCGAQGISYNAVVNGLIWATDNGADIISMSFFFSTIWMNGFYNFAMDYAVDYAYDNGVVLFAATANDNADTILYRYPANHPRVISVGAATPAGERKSSTSSDGVSTWGSNYGLDFQDHYRAVDIMAPTFLPTTDIVGAEGYSPGDYGLYMDGTSCSTPYVAGVAALLLSKTPGLTPAQIKQALQQTATDMTVDGGIGWDRYTGYGLVNARDALLWNYNLVQTCELTATDGDSVINRFWVGDIVYLEIGISNPAQTNRVEFFLDMEATPIHVAFNAPFTFEWDTSDVRNGFIDVRAVAHSNQGYTGVGFTRLDATDRASKIWNPDIIIGTWDNPNSWMPYGVPDATHRVEIPGRGTVIINTPAYARSVEIYSQGKLDLQSSLIVMEEFVVRELLTDVPPVQINHPNASLTVGGYIKIEMDGKFIVDHPDVQVQCGGDLIIEPDATFQMLNGTFIFTGNQMVDIVNQSPVTRVSNVILQKDNFAFVNLSGSSTENILIDGYLRVAQGNRLRSYSLAGIELKGDLISENTTGTGLALNDGTLKLTGVNQSITSPRAGDYFNNILVQSSGTVTLGSNIRLLGNFNLVSGTVNANYRTVRIGGDFNNSSGVNAFQQTSGKIVFDGGRDSSISSGTYTRVELEKSGNGKLLVDNRVLVFNQYKWLSGAIEINSSTMQIMSLLNPSIMGKYVLNTGMLFIIQPTGSINMNADVTINGGEMRVWGTYSTSYWAQDGDARLVMTDGILDFVSSGITIPNSSHTMDFQVSGGVIRTVGNFQCQRPGFEPTAGAIELSGTADTSFSVHPQSSIHDLIINKQNRAGNNGSEQDDGDRTSYNSRVFITTNSSIRGSLMHQHGELRIGNATFTVEGEAEIAGKVVLSQASSKLKVKQTLYWLNNAGSLLNNGTIELQNGLDITSGSVFQMGASANLRFVGISSAPDDLSDVVPGTNYARIEVNAADTRFGNLIIDKVDWTDFEILGNQILTVLGNMTIQGQTWVTLESMSVIVNGNLTQSAHLIVTDNSSLVVSGNYVNTSGYLSVREYSFMECKGSFDHQIASEMEIDTYGHLRLSRPYAGVYYSLAGYVAIYETGCLEVFHNGLQIGTDNFVLEGGTIKIGWAFRAMNPNTFNGGTGTVEFIGARVGQIQMHTSNSFYDLLINKPGLGYSVSLMSQVTVARDLTIQDGTMMLATNLLRVNRDVLIQGGKLHMAGVGDMMHVARNWINTVGSAAFDEGNGTVQFVDTGNYDSIIPTESFHQLIINKAVGKKAELLSGSTLTVKGGLNIAFRRLTLHPGSTLKVNSNSSLLIGSNGELYAVGTQANPVTISSDNGYYNFQTVSGSKLSARYCVFEKMNNNGINLALGSIVDLDHPMSYCTFRNGQSGGTLLKKYNTQQFITMFAHFPANTWGSAFNVHHANNAGHLIFRGATGEFANYHFEDDPGDKIIWSYYTENPNVAHSPLPSNNAVGVEPSSNLGWTYTAHQSFANPIGYIVRMGLVPDLSTYQEIYISGGPGTYSIAPLIALQVGNTYYWQVIPTTETQARDGFADIGNAGDDRGPAEYCPIWSFSVSETVIGSFPYYEDFESGPGGWYGGAISNLNLWEWGESSQFGAYSDSYVWATYLNQNYINSANCWLRSPTFNLSGVTAPMFRVWLNIKTELNYDGMILEYSTNGSTWTKVEGDPGFYNNTVAQGPLGQPKWSGEIGVWTQYTTSIPALANQPQGYLRFRFASDSSVVSQGIAVEDIEIWDADFVPSFSWEENFNTLGLGTIPAGWTRTETNWGANSSSFAGGVASEMRFNWSPQVNGNSYLKTPALNTSGFSNLNLSFKHMIDHYGGPYTLKLVSIVGSTEYVLREWVNPESNIAATTVNQSISAAQGAGASNLQLAWVFSGNSNNIDYWYIDDVLLESVTAGPGMADSPAPYSGAENIALSTSIGWAYASQTGYPDPVGFRLRIGTSPTMASFTETYVVGGPGYYTVDSPIPLLYGSTYYWQVIPTTDLAGRGLDNGSAIPGLASEVSIRSDALGCPIWSFSTVPLPPVTQYPYLASFESGPAGWTSGAISGSNQWELGYPSQTVITGPYSGGNAWMTYLGQNYENNANCWLKSPVFDFSELDAPNFSVWLNIWTELNWDGMIMEYSLDNLNWIHLVRNDGFYNNSSTSGPLAPPKWSGLSGNWTRFITTLPELANQPTVWLRFRFASDASIAEEGIALDDVRIWNTIAPPATAHSPIPVNESIDIPLQTYLGWTYTSEPGFTDPVVYQIRAGTDPTLSTYSSSVLWAGPGTHLIDPFFELEIGQTYYWQVIPSANADAYRGTSIRSGFSTARSDELTSGNSQFRDTAIDCPIWSFSTVSEYQPISNFPYFEDFELGDGGWRSGSNSGLNIWQHGTPAQTVINNAYSGSNAWMTGLGMNYMNNSDIWLRSPLMDFTTISEPRFSVRINHQSQADYDGMILEASIDGGATWSDIAGDAGFYNNTSGLGPIPQPKWSGNSTGWTLYSTALSGLEHQPAVRLRFRFASDASVIGEGFAIDDVRVWNREFAEVDIAPISYDFGRVELGESSVVQQFEISNTGAGILYLYPENISIISINPDDFELINLSAPAELTTGQSISIGIRFSPVSVGNRTATLSIQEGTAPARSTELSLSMPLPTRNLHLIPLSGFGYQLITLNVPYYEGFGTAEIGSLPAGWESSNPNWQVSGNNQAGGEAPELYFSFDPRIDGEVTLLSPLFDTSSLSQINLSFKHRVHHLDNAFDLKLYTLVGSQYRLIQEWLIVDADIAAETLSYQLSTASHGVGANNLRLAFVFSGDSYHVSGWHLDELILGGTTATAVTSAATGVTHFEAVLNASVTSDGGLPIQTKGFYYGTDPDPQNEGVEILSDVPGNSFSAAIDGLDPGTVVYYLAFVDNPRGRAWGSVLSFQSLAPAMVLNPESIPDFGGVVAGTVSLPQSFTISGSNLLGDVTINAPGGFYLAISGRDRAERYASELVLEPVAGMLAPTLINVFFEPASTGHYNGDILISSPSFTSQIIALSGTGITLATVATNPVTEIGTESARSGGNITDDGWSTISACGICWSTDPQPTLADSNIAQNPINWNYSLLMSGLMPNTTYYVRAYAINAAGVAYGEAQMFNTAMLDLQTPQNIVISASASTVTLSWDAVPNALSYRIYRSDDPYTTNWGTPVAVTGSTNWSGLIGTSIGFYRIVAATDIVR